MSRNLNIASVLLLIVGADAILGGLMASFAGEWWLDGWISVMNEELRPPTVSEIRGLGQNLLDFMMFMLHAYGIIALCAGLFICVTSLIPYRKGEKWAWYTILVIGGIYTLGGLIGTYIGMTAWAPLTIILFILWIVGLALPAKEILSKPS